jgi:hypothetical protein
VETTTIDLRTPGSLQVNLGFVFDGTVSPANIQYNDQRYRAHVKTPTIQTVQQYKSVVAGKFDYDSSAHANRNFWVIHVVNVFQGNTDSDKDPNSETVRSFGVTPANIDRTAVRSGGDLSLFYRENITEQAGQTGIQIISRTEVHEIGHQLGLDHNRKSSNTGIMEEKASKLKDYFSRKDRHFLRSRQATPGIVNSKK